jgi:kinesin family member C1
MSTHDDDNLFSLIGGAAKYSPLKEFDPPGLFPPHKEMMSSYRPNLYKENFGGNVFAAKPDFMTVSKSSENVSPLKVESDDTILPSRLDQLERERKEMLLQQKIREEKDKALSAHNLLLEERVKKLEADIEKYEGDLNASRHENFALKTEKDNLANEVRKLTRQNGQVEGQSLWGQMTSASRELCRAEEEIKSLNRDLLEAREKNTMLTRQQEKYDIKEKASERTLQELINERKRKNELEDELESSLRDNAELSARLADIDASYDTFRKESETSQQALQEQIVRYQQEIDELESALREGGNRGKGSNASGESYSEEYDEEGAELHPRKRRISDISASERETEYEETIADLRQKLLESESRRRKLHNKIQDLRGNVRVFVRCRPFLPSDAVDNPDEKCVICNAEGTTVSLSEHCSRGAGQVFQFDNVYNPQQEQEHLFADVKDLIQSALDGYRVCVFSYGQTGSGKTHTMTGTTHGDSRGLIPRSIEVIIEQINMLKEAGWDVTATYSMLEVYNETLNDLLDESSSSDSGKLKISMQHDKVVVQNLTSVPMVSTSVEEGMNQLSDILKQTNSARTTASTAMNERSSRSHVLFMMELTSIHEDGTVMQGGLRLVDLAGSERLDRTGTLADATRLRETVNINKSLSCLGDVFMALGHKQSHVPFRNSKLTMLLQVIMYSHATYHLCPAYY